MMGMSSTDADQRLQTEDYKKVVLPGACGFNWFSATHKKLGKISAQSQTYIMCGRFTCIHSWLLITQSSQGNQKKFELSGNQSK